MAMKQRQHHKRLKTQALIASNVGAGSGVGWYSGYWCLVKEENNNYDNNASARMNNL